MFDCSDRWSLNNSSAEERNQYFRALQHELNNGGLEAMFYDLKNIHIGDWHPRKIPLTEALREQILYSLLPVERWMLQFASEALLPKAAFAFRVMDTEQSRKPTDYFVATVTFAENARSRVPALKNKDDFAIRAELLNYGCVPHSTGRERGLKFQILPEFRAALERKTRTLGLGSGRRRLALGEN